jgi:diacylglycerol kinase (ATP)
VTRVFVVVNPAAGGGRTAKRWPAIRAELERLGADFAFALTTARGEATVLARRAVAEGWPRVAAVGGDGTLNEVVEGVVDPDGTARAAVGHVPTGRGRDGARNLGLAVALRLAARNLVEGGERRVDLGIAEWPDGRGCYFVNAAGVGLDAAIAQATAPSTGRGRLPYLRAALAALPGHRPVPAEIMVDDALHWRGRVTAVVVANGASYGGGMRIAPRADPADGRLDLVVVGDIGRLGLLAWLPALYTGAHLRHPRVSHLPVTRVRIEAPSPLPVHVDGEAAPPTPVTFTIAPGALRLAG